MFRWINDLSLRQALKGMFDNQQSLINFGQDLMPDVNGPYVSVLVTVSSQYKCCSVPPQARVGTRDHAFS
jgi:hypothetical protein